MAYARLRRLWWRILYSLRIKTPYRVVGKAEDLRHAVDGLVPSPSRFTRLLTGQDYPVKVVGKKGAEDEG